MPKSWLNAKKVIISDIIYYNVCFIIFSTILINTNMRLIFQVEKKSFVTVLSTVGSKTIQVLEIIREKKKNIPNAVL